MDEQIRKLVGEEELKITREQKDMEQEAKFTEWIRNGEAEIGGSKIEFKQISVLDEKIKIYIPENFEIMDNETEKIKYPFDRRPEIIYTNNEATINISLNYTQNQLRNNQIEKFLENMKNILTKVQMSTEIIESKVKEAGNKIVGIIEFIVQGIDEKIYNVLAFTELEGRALFISFNCTEEEMEQWKYAAKGIINNITIIEYS